VVVLFLGKIITSLILKIRKAQADPTKLMFFGGLIVAPLPALWPFADSVALMFVLHFLSGMAWASWEVGLGLCIFKNVSAEEKAETVSAYNYLSAFTQVLGTLAGAGAIKFIFVGNYAYLFYFSGLLRLISALPLHRNKLKAVSEPLIPQSTSSII
jgi:sugar phosphate permease